MIEQDDAVLVLHRHQRLFERTVGPRPCSLLLGMQRVGIDVLTAEAFKGGDQVGTHALWREVTVQVGRRVQRPGPAIAAHRHPGHRLDTTDHHQVFETGTHFHRAEVHGLQPRSTEPVDLYSRHADIPIGHLSGSLGDVGTLITNRGYAAKHHIIDLAGVQRCALLQCGEQTSHQVHRFDAVQGAIGLAFATGRA
ncbi:hypothetical protein D3C71_1389510 [compost metagenome]